MASMESSDVICYHYPCADGIFAALAAHIAYKQQGKAPRFFPLTVFKQHAADELQLQGHELVYMCDFSGPAGFAQQAASKAKRLVVLDHHKTAVDQLQAPGVVLPPNMEVHLDMGRSGARIALDWFKPQLPPALHKAFMHVEDADLWRWALEGSREFHAGLGALSLEYDVHKNPDIFDQLQALDPDAVIQQGKEVLEAQARWIAKTMASAFPVQLGGAKGQAQGWGRCLAVEIASDMAHNRSSLGNSLAQASVEAGLRPISVIAYREKGMSDPTAIKLSLRGVGENTDTTPVSSAFGGGGHKLASSCIVPAEEFSSWQALGAE